MATVIAFLLGAFVSGATLALVFGALHLEKEEKTYWEGYRDGLDGVHEVYYETDFE